MGKGSKLSQNWVEDFVEKLSNVEGRFELYAAIFLKYDNRYNLVIKDSKDWVYENDRRKAPLSTFGGKIENRTDPVKFLQDYCSRELETNITIYDSNHTYIDYHHRLKKIPVDLVKGGIKPFLITILQKARHSANSNRLIFSYLGEAKYKPHYAKYSAMVYASERVLVQMFKTEKSVQELKKAGATIDERIKIPDYLYLFPTGSLNSLLRYLSYEVF